ncbi:hypothetical protein NQD34_000742 [Periophthalmus magnuspinnatus]|nr:hypothetical protein NQD34_000742 [Periophthalmus magnuspinnatus]
MSLKGHPLRGLVMERLAVAADEIFALFERTFAQYEEEVLRSKLQQQPRDVFYKEDIQTVTVGVDVYCDQVNTEEAIKIKRQVNPPIKLQRPSVTLKSKEPDPQEKMEDLTREQCDEEEPGCSLDFILDKNGQPYSCSDADDSIDWVILDEKTTKCNEQKHVMNKRDLAKHGDQLYKCNQCSKSFKSKRSLEKHLQIHTRQVTSSKSKPKEHLVKQKPHRCSVCKRGFSQKRHLVDHMRIHTGEKPFSCSHCEMKFRQQYSLMRHIFSKHSEYKPHSCPVCLKGFVEKGSLVLHMRKHTGE